MFVPMTVVAKQVSFIGFYLLLFFECFLCTDAVIIAPIVISIDPIIEPMAFSPFCKFHFCPLDTIDGLLIQFIKCHYCALSESAR